jgi:hypothetical protein
VVFEQHSNLWELGFNATILMVNKTTWVFREFAAPLLPLVGESTATTTTSTTIVGRRLPIPGTNDTTCCFIRSLSGLVPFRPDFLRRPETRHTYVGNSHVNGKVARVFYSPLMASTFWDLPLDDGVLLQEGMFLSREGHSDGSKLGSGKWPI